MAMSSWQTDSPVALTSEATEFAVLASILFKPAAFKDVTLTADTFERRECREMYQTMERLHSQGCLDETRFSVEAHETFESLSERAALNFDPRNLQHYASDVLRLSRLRNQAEVGKGITAAAQRGEAIPDDMLVQLVSRTQRTSGESSEGFWDLSHRVADEIDSGKNRCVVSPPDFDDIGIERGELVLVAAGTSWGKTALALDWADEWSKEHDVAFYEYEP